MSEKATTKPQNTNKTSRVPSRSSTKPTRSSPTSTGSRLGTSSSRTTASTVGSGSATSSSSRSSRSSTSSVLERRRKKGQVRKKKKGGSRRRPADLSGIAIPSRHSEIPSFEVDSETFKHINGLSINSDGIKEDCKHSYEDRRNHHRGSWIRSLEELDQNKALVLGRGSTGIVVKARHKPTHKYVAIKKMTIYQRETRHQLLKEIRALYEADCPELVDFYGAFYKDGTISIVLEFMDAGSLQSVLNAYGKIPEEVTAAVAVQILKGLSYLHTRVHKVHRDIKPPNICVSFTGQVKITDFGISADLQNSIAVCDTFVGTCNYMSPERIKGGAYSWPGDIWGLGLCLLECVVGRFPYPDSGIYIELVQAIADSPLPDFSQEGLSEDFMDFVDICLKKDPKLRPNAAELLKHKWLQSVPEDPTVIVSEWLRKVDPKKSLKSEAKRRKQREREKEREKEFEKEKSDKE